MTTLSTYDQSPFSVAAQGYSKPPRIGILSTYAPTLCGLATFSAGLAKGLTEHGAEVSIVRISDEVASDDPRVVAELDGTPSSTAACVQALNANDIAVIQHGDDIYGGVDGDEVVDLLGSLTVPSIVIAHTTPSSPTRQQRWVIQAVATLANQVVVMSDSARRRLCAEFDIESRKVITIPHGASVPMEPAGGRCRRPTIVTWGLLRPGKGIERVIDAMPSLRDVPGRPMYLVAGRTHPKTLAAEGEAYRDSLIERARSIGVADSVTFDSGYRNGSMLTALAQSAALIALPYDSTDLASSGVLVDALANGRPVVATSFPHAVELLSSGAGAVVDHDDQDAFAATLRRVLTQPRLSGQMAAEARRMAPEMAWPVVADAYLRLARRVIAQRRAAV